MSFSAPSPPASTSSNSSSKGSPQPDLELDPSDPLNLLLRNSQSTDSAMDDSTTGGSPPDWSQLSALWSSSLDGGNMSGEYGMKAFPDVMDYNIPLSSELDFTSQMAIDPHALHFDTQKLGLDDFSLPNELNPLQNYSFTSQLNTLASPPSRRLSIASSSSSSGVSLSPMIDSSPAPALLNAPQALPLGFLDSAADELARKVRQSAGVMLAVPMNAQLQQNIASTPYFAMFPGQTSGLDQTLRNNFAQQPASPQSLRSLASSTSSASSTPPPTTPPPTEHVNPNISINASVSDANAYINAVGIIPMMRPKTSHTTIERRYRTNLNARITSLKMAVPALRVLEDKEGCGVGGGGKKGKGRNSTLGKNVVFGSKVKKEGEDGEDVVDVIDERGFVDGVKVARKCSKANVLGKAVEYIRVLKKREIRLKREQHGLKALVNGLVGGPALLSEWEREWRERFGGEEKDEVEGEDIDDGGSYDEGSGDDDDAEDEGTRKRKKAKITPTKKDTKEKRPPAPPPQPFVLPDGSVIVPEKRKRGRPRKVIPPVVAAVTEQPVPLHHPGTQESAVHQQHPHHAQYLLATFALFSFFNNPLSSSHPPPNHSHTGAVLTHELSSSANGYSGWTWHNIIQAFHLLVSIVVFSSILAPWFPTLFKYVSSHYVSLKKLSFHASLPRSPRSRTVSLVEALSPSKRGIEREAAELRDALGSHHGVIATIKTVVGKDKEKVGFEQAGLEQRAWIRLGELSVLGEKTSLLDRALTCLHMRSHLSWFTASAADLSTLALALWPLGHFVHRRARSIWDAARARKGFSGVREGGVGVQVRPHERLVLESTTLDDAVARLKSPVARQSQDVDWNRYSPIAVLACMIVKERVKHHLELMFIRTVLPNEDCYELEDVSAAVISDSVEDKQEEERRKTVEAARSLGGKMAELGDSLQRMWTMGIWELDNISPLHNDADDDEELDLDAEIRVLLNALILYRQIFSSSILGSANSGVSVLLSPPPSPIRQDMKLHYALRRVLGSSVFESENGNGVSGAMEDARDRLVDKLVECERAGR
ncbi:hypothetical protein J3R30DRAFT_3554706 [Lentinula aciculospora]|uniref:BHLH domain-containing protein n=1 Tax=Lentinula aciculospora TaxID=153920 RepID=A0A9W9DH34_9AGAR|nr:hypothetical protein J3R30DRAFT_3554706 [Lentinula aciculospora]